jgi:predicted Fe-Mo cluster-binding NifX family protein
MHAGVGAFGWRICSAARGNVLCLERTSGIRRYAQMLVVVSAMGDSLDAPVCLLFGRCPHYLFVDTDTMQYEAVSSKVLDGVGGVGVLAAQYAVRKGVDAVITGNIGESDPFDMLRAEDVPVYIGASGTVRQAVEEFTSRRLDSIAQSSTRERKAT